MPMPFTLEIPHLKNHGYAQRLGIKYIILREKNRNNPNVD